MFKMSPALAHTNIDLHRTVRRSEGRGLTILQLDALSVDTSGIANGFGLSL